MSHRPEMRTARRIAGFGATLAMMIGVAATAARAAPQTAAEIANYTGPDRAMVILEGARKEGQVLLYTGATSAILDHFRKKYPFLKVDAAQSDAPGHVRRMSEEYKAGRHIADIVATSNGGLHALKAMGNLQPFASPELAVFRPDAVEPGRHWAQVFESYVSLGFNTKAVSIDQAPKTLDDLLDPKWMGKMAFPGTTLPNWIGSVVRNKGDKGAESYLQKLAQNKLGVHQISGRALANLVVSGEISLSPSTFSSHMADSKKAGASVAWRPLDGVYANVSSISLAKYPPHPHAAMLYIDFMLSKEGQILHQEIGYSSGRTDLDNPDSPSARFYLGDEPDYEANFSKWSDLGRKIFGRGEPAKGK